jgi:hypothetical protein
MNQGFKYQKRRRKILRRLFVLKNCLADSVLKFSQKFFNASNN